MLNDQCYYNVRTIPSPKTKSYRSIDFHEETKDNFDYGLCVIKSSPFGYTYYNIFPTLSSEHARNTKFSYTKLCNYCFSSHIISMCLSNKMSFVVTLLVSVCNRQPHGI